MRSIVLAFVLLTLTLAAPARAADEVAQRSFDQGMALMKEGKFKEACRQFMDSDTIGPTIASAYQLGLCNNGLKKYGTARKHFLAAADRAAAKKDKKRAGVAKNRAREAEEKAARIVITVPAESAAQGLLIKLDTIAVPGEAIGKPIYLDNKKISLVATAPGRATYQTTLDGTAVGAKIDFSLPKLEATGSATPVAVPTPGPDGPKMKRHGAWKAGLGLTISGPIVLLIGVGLIVASQAEDDLGDQLGFTSNERPGIGVGIAVGAVGAAMTTAGIILLVKFSDKVPVKKARIEPLISPRLTGIRVRF